MTDTTGTGLIQALRKDHSETKALRTATTRSRSGRNPQVQGFLPPAQELAAEQKAPEPIRRKTEPPPPPSPSVAAPISAAIAPPPPLDGDLGLKTMAIQLGPAAGRELHEPVVLPSAQRLPGVRRLDTRRVVKLGVGEVDKAGSPGEGTVLARDKVKTYAAKTAKLQVLKARSLLLLDKIAEILSKYDKNVSNKDQLCRELAQAVNPVLQAATLREVEIDGQNTFQGIVDGYLSESAGSLNFVDPADMSELAKYFAKLLAFKINMDPLESELSRSRFYDEEEVFAVIPSLGRDPHKVLRDLEQEALSAACEDPDYKTGLSGDDDIPKVQTIYVGLNPAPKHINADIYFDRELRKIYDDSPERVKGVSKNHGVIELGPIFSFVKDIKASEKEGKTYVGYSANSYRQAEPGTYTYVSSSDEVKMGEMVFRLEPRSRAIEELVEGQFAGTLAFNNLFRLSFHEELVDLDAMVLEGQASMEILPDPEDSAVALASGDQGIVDDPPPVSVRRGRLGLPSVSFRDLRRRGLEVADGLTQGKASRWLASRRSSNNGNGTNGANGNGNGNDSH